MYLLKSKDFTHSEEMNKLCKYHKQHIGNFPRVQPYIAKLDSIKNELGFGEKQKYH